MTDRASIPRAVSAAGEGEVVGDTRPLVPDGIYRAIFIRAETARAFGKSSKVYAWFRIVEGPQMGEELYRAFNVRELVGPPKKGGRFKLSRRSDLYSTMVKLLDLKLRPDRISLTSLTGKIVEIAVRKVTTDARQRLLATFDQYTVVSDIVRIVEG